MMSNRSIAKKYTWSDKSDIKTCIGSFEYDFAQFADILMNFPSNDIIMPAPMIIEYEYNGKTHFYIPDAYISSLNLIVEIKDGSDNPNTHPKIMEVDKVKEKAKEDALRKQSKYNYVKIENKQYAIFVKTLYELKEQENVGNEGHTFIPIIMVNEYAEMLSEYVIPNDSFICPDFKYVMFHIRNFPIVEYGLLIGNDIYVYRDNIINRISLDSVIVTNSIDVTNAGIANYQYNELLENINSYVGRPLSDDVTNENFPATILYELDNYKVFFSNKDNAYSFNMDKRLLQESYGMCKLSEFTNSKMDDDFVKSNLISIKNMVWKSIDNNAIKKYKSDCKSLSHVRVMQGYDGYILLNGDSVLGYVNVNHNDNSIQALYTNDKYRGSGIGAQLLDFAIYNMNANNLSVNKNNEVAIRMYENKGFKVISQDGKMLNMHFTKNSNESVENIDMKDIDIKFKRTIDEIYNFNPNKMEKDMISLALNAKTEDNLEVIESYLILITDHMKYTLFNTLIELKRMIITVINQ